MRCVTYNLVYTFVSFSFSAVCVRGVRDICNLGLHYGKWDCQPSSGTVVKYHLLTESEVIIGKSQTSALMYWPSDSEVNTSRPRSEMSEVWDVMTERTRLISYLLCGLFSAILKNNTIKTPEVIFHIRLRALWLSLSIILKKYLYASFPCRYWKYSCTLSSFLLFSPKRS